MVPRARSIRQLAPAAGLGIELVEPRYGAARMAVHDAARYVDLPVPDGRARAAPPAIGRDFRPSPPRIGGGVVELHRIKGRLLRVLPPHRAHRIDKIPVCDRLEVMDLDRRQPESAPAPGCGIEFLDRFHAASSHQVPLAADRHHGGLVPGRRSSRHRCSRPRAVGVDVCRLLAAVHQQACRQGDKQGSDSTHVLSASWPGWRRGRRHPHYALP